METIILMLIDDALHSSILFKLLVFAGWAAKRVSNPYKKTCFNYNQKALT